MAETDTGLYIFGKFGIRLTGVNCGRSSPPHHAGTVKAERNRGEQPISPLSGAAGHILGNLNDEATMALRPAARSQLRLPLTL